MGGEKFIQILSNKNYLRLFLRVLPVNTDKLCFTLLNVFITLFLFFRISVSIGLRAFLKADDKERKNDLVIYIYYTNY